LPSRLPATRSEPVQEGQREHDDKQQGGPAGDGQDDLGRERRADELEQDGQHDDSADRRKGEEDESQREQEGGAIEAHEAATLALAVDHVQRIEERGDP
jgi:hypothetical protein